jgi:recombination protein U
VPRKKKEEIVIAKNETTQDNKTTKAKTKKKTSTANRGLDFEELIEKVCEKYRENKIAIINKVPTEWKVLRRYNPSKRKSEIFNAFPVEESRFVDFIGIYNALPIAIEAKSTNELTRFPFANIKETQINFLRLWNELGGKGYYIIRFQEHKKVFLVQSETMHHCMETIDRKSAPYEWFLDTNNAVELDYIELDFISCIR